MHFELSLEKVCSDVSMTIVLTTLNCVLRNKEKLSQINKMCVLGNRSENLGIGTQYFSLFFFC